MAYTPILDKLGINGDEEMEPFDYRPQKHRAVFRWTSFLSQIYIVLSTTTIAVLLLTRKEMSGNCDTAMNQSYHSLGMDTVGTHETQYGRDTRFMSLDPQFDSLWLGWGAEAQFTIPDELSPGNSTPVSVSMYHQMHCLSSFRTALQNARQGKTVAYDWHEDHHWPHCLDYLRRTILCWADDTLETMPIVNGKRLPFIDGARDIRRCRRQEEIQRLVEEAQGRAKATSI